MKYAITILFFLLSLTNTTFAQVLNTFTLNQNGKKIVVTKDISPDFLGFYTKTEGNQKWEYALSEKGGSFYFKQTLSDPFNNKYDWDNSKKQEISWGVLVENGKIAEKIVSEYKNGKIESYKAMILVYKINTSNKTYDVLLYEKNGSFHLESTTKTTTVASLH